MPHVVAEVAQARHITGDPVIREMPEQLRRQGGPLLLDRLVAVLAAPRRHGRDGPPEADPGRLALHRPVPLERPTPVVGEPQEVERAGAFLTGTRWGPRRTPLERDQPGLLRMEGQAVLPESLREHVQGLVVCKGCGYGCYGKPTSRAGPKGEGRVPYAYYRCTGSDAYRFGGQRLCWNKQTRTDMLDAAVWDDVRGLLSEPERVRGEYERRLQGARTGPSQEVEHLSKLVSNVKKLISRLIDAYGDGLLDKSEFEPRISAARTRLAKLEGEQRQRIGEASQEAELRLVIGQLEAFAGRVSEGLQEPDWDTRREIVRALVKRVEVDEKEVRIVYRVSPSPFEGSPQQRRSQHCWERDFTHPRQRLSS
jgi:hypothetical protein